MDGTPFNQRQRRQNYIYLCLINYHSGAIDPFARIPFLSFDWFAPKKSTLFSSSDGAKESFVPVFACEKGIWLFVEGEKIS